MPASLAHAAGDEVLRRIAAVLRANLRHNDLAARIGGEEFVDAHARRQRPLPRQAGRPEPGAGGVGRRGRRQPVAALSAVSFAYRLNRRATASGFDGK
ncbi:MAG: diguanylate cyclase [Propionivibrio sp.]|nr:diguanylate cyclase [Propionivibrio sp.]